MTELRPGTRSAIIRKSSSVMVHFQDRPKSLRIDETVVLTSARVSVPAASPTPDARSSAETVVEFPLQPGKALTAVRPEPVRDAGPSDADRLHVERVLAHLRSTCDKLLADRGSRLEQWQAAAVELAATMAAKLLHREVTAGTFRFDETIRDMAKQLGDDIPVSVRLHPDDVDSLERNLNGGPLLSADRDPRVVPDRSLTRGEVRIDGKETVLLSSMTNQLQSIRDELLGRLGHAGA